MTIGEGIQYYACFRDNHDEVQKLNLTKPHGQVEPILDLSLHQNFEITMDADIYNPFVLWVASYWKNNIEPYRFKPRWWLRTRLEMNNIKIEWRKQC